MVKKKIVSKRLVMTVLKSVLHIAIYILLGLLLAFFINHTAQAAELDYTEYPHYYGEIEYEDYEGTEDYYAESPPYLATPTAVAFIEPVSAHGRLLVTSRASRAHDTGDLLQGVVFEVRRAIDDVFMAQIVTNQFGEASVNLAAGDYFLREIAAPLDFIANPNRVSVRVQADRLTETNITHRPVPMVQEVAYEPPIPETVPDGRLLITNREQARGTGAPLAGATFEVRSIMDDILVAQLTANQFGEASVNLPAGDYFIRQTAPSAGFILDSARTNIRIASGELRSITIINEAEPIENEIEIVEDTPIYGRLLVTLMSGANGERLPHGIITVHDIMTDAHIATLSSNYFGEASILLPAGRYFLRQAAMPQGYLPNFDRIPFTVNAGDISDMSLVVRAKPVPVPPPAPATTQTNEPTPPPAVIEIIPDDEPDMQSRIEIVTRAAGSGNPLSGGLFAVYRAHDSRRMAELTTGTDGMVDLEVEAGLYFIRELRPTFGFLLETERIFLEVGEGETVIVELTKLRDSSIPYLPPDENGSGFIYITQTGQFMSALHYGGGGLMLVIALASVGLILYEVLFNKKRRILYA